MESRQSPEDFLPRKQLWVIVQLDDHGWVLDQVDGQYVDIRLDRVSFPSSSKVIITPHEGAVYRKEGGASGLLSIDGVAVVGEIFCLPPSPERDGIQIHARVDNCKVQRLRDCQHSSGQICDFDRYTLEISTPVDCPQPPQERIAYRCGLSQVTDAELRDHSGSSAVTQKWELHSSPDGSSYALMSVDDRSICKPLESFELQESGCSTKVVIKMLIEMNALSPMPLRGLVNCGGFEIAGIVTNIERGRWAGQEMATIEAWLCGSASRGDRSFTFAVRPFQSDHSSHVIPPAMGSAREIVTYSFHWRDTPVPDVISRASAEGFTRQDCRFFQENEYLRCGVNPYGPCEGCGDYAKDEVE